MIVLKTLIVIAFIYSSVEKWMKKILKFNFCAGDDIVFNKSRKSHLR